MNPGMVRGRPTRPQLRLLAAVCTVHERDGRATIRSVTREAGLASPGSTIPTLRRLRRMGLICWEPQRNGTLRPAPGVVLIGGEPHMAGTVGKCWLTSENDPKHPFDDGRLRAENESGPGGASTPRDPASPTKES